MLPRQAVLAAATAGRASSAPRFGDTSGPNGFRTLPILKVPLGPSPNDPSMPLELQMEVLTPEGGLFNGLVASLVCGPTRLCQAEGLTRLFLSALVHSVAHINSQALDVT